MYVAYVRNGGENLTEGLHSTEFPSKEQPEMLAINTQL